MATGSAPSSLRASAERAVFARASKCVAALLERHARQPPFGVGTSRGSRAPVARASAVGMQPSAKAEGKPAGEDTGNTAAMQPPGGRGEPNAVGMQPSAKAEGKSGGKAEGKPVGARGAWCGCSPRPRPRGNPAARPKGSPWGRGGHGVDAALGQGRGETRWGAAGTVGRRALLWPAAALLAARGARCPVRAAAARRGPGGGITRGGRARGRAEGRRSR